MIAEAHSIAALWRRLGRDPAVLALVVALAALGQPNDAKACSGQYEIAALRPGTPVLSADGAIVWAVAEDASWIHIAPDGTARAVPVPPATNTRIASASGSTFALLDNGPMLASCSVVWHQSGRVVVHVSAGTGSRSAAPRLVDLDTVFSFAVTESGRRAAVGSSFELAILDFDLGRIARRVETSTPAYAAWLDEDHVAWLSEEGLQIAHVRDGLRAPIEIEHPLAPALSAEAIAEQALLPEHPGCIESERARFALLAADASPSSVTVVAVAADRCDRWQLMRLDTSIASPRVELASWIGEGHLLAVQPTRVLVARGGRVELLDRATGATLARVAGGRRFVAGGISRDGSHFAVATRPPVRPRGPDDWIEESTLARGGEGELAVEVFRVADGQRRAWGRAAPSRFTAVP